MENPLPEVSTKSDTRPAAASLDQTSNLRPQPPATPDYELLRRIGQGSYGEVWLARNVMGEYRAVKIVHRAAFGGDNRPFEREFEAVRKFEPISRSHESQLPILHVGLNEAAGCFYYVMELADDAAEPPRVEGVAPHVASSRLSTQTSLNYTPRTLRFELERHGRLPLSQCLDIALALTTALMHLHRHGLVHRDIKPSNIIFLQGRPKLADIGLVTDVGDAKSIVGTEGYLAPEGPGTPQADLYSLGKVLYEISTGRDRRHFPDLPLDLVPQNGGLPERRSSRREAQTSQSAIGNRRSEIKQSLLTSAATGLLELNEILLKACARDPCQRYQSAQEMAADLALLQVGKSVRRKRRAGHYWQILRRSFPWLAVAAFVLALFTLSGWLRSPPSNPETRLRSTNSLANDYYDVGRSMYLKNTEPEIARAAEKFEAAVREDPNFALALAALAAAWSWESVGTNHNWALLPRAKEIAERALRIDDSLSEAHLAIAEHAFIKEWDWPKAERHFLRATRLHASDAQAHAWYGLFLRSMGRMDEALRELHKAVDLDPRSQVANRFLGLALFSARRYPEAIVKARKAADLSSDVLDFRLLRQALMWSDRIDEALAVSERAVAADELSKVQARARAVQLKRVFHEQGLDALWRNRLEFLKTDTQDPMHIAGAYASASEAEEALRQLELAYQEHHVFLVFDIKTHPQWDCFRNHP